VEPLKKTPTTELLTPRPTQTTTASQPIATAMTADLNQEYDHTRQGSDNEEQKHWIIGGNDITSLFLKYRYQADVIPKPVPLESNIQEILALSDVLFLANEQHSECKMTVFGE
jgi:dihydrofolate reductase